MPRSATTPKKIQIPCLADEVSRLRVGDPVRLSGRIVTARDLAHKRMVQSCPSELRDVLKGSFIYHCGPVVIRREASSVGRWNVVSAGPTTSIREEPYQADVIREYGLRGVIGKGGMGKSTMAALVETGSVYLHATGGAGALLAACVVAVEDVFYLDEFGVPEAMWIMQVRDFPAIVTMDSTGHNLHEQVLAGSRTVRDRFLDNARQP